MDDIAQLLGDGISQNHSMDTIDVHLRIAGQAILNPDRVSCQRMMLYRGKQNLETLHSQLCNSSSPEPEPEPAQELAKLVNPFQLV